MSNALITWQRWFCLGQRCAPREWLVQRDADDTWTIVEAGGALYSVASNVPVCPCCSDTLHPVVLTETAQTRGKI
jgi:hypothetical protein